MLARVLDEIVVPTLWRGRARMRPDVVIADRAYSSGTTRRILRRHRITAVIPQKCDEIAARQRRGRAGGRPPALDETLYRQCNLVERSFACSNNGARWPLATTSSPSSTALLSS
jgi:hypothetical protein